MRDALAAGCDILTIGQYLQPTKNHLPVVQYVAPDEFKAYEETGLELGFGRCLQDRWCAAHFMPRKSPGHNFNF
jgi:lipoate synthase